MLPALQVLTISVWPFVEQQGEILEETTMLATEIRSRWHAHWRRKLVVEAFRIVLYGLLSHDVTGKPPGAPRVRSRLQSCIVILLSSTRRQFGACFCCRRTSVEMKTNWRCSLVHIPQNILTMTQANKVFLQGNLQENLILQDVRILS